MMENLKQIARGENRTRSFDLLNESTEIGFEVSIYLFQKREVITS